MGRELIWSDEFDGPDGALPDEATWGFEIGDSSADFNPGWGNEELQTYVPGTANVAQDGQGNLVVSARRDPRGFTSARLSTKGKREFQYVRSGPEPLRHDVLPRPARGVRKRGASDESPCAPRDDGLAGARPERVGGLPRSRSGCIPFGEISILARASTHSRSGSPPPSCGS
jgi:hypothetical protein